MFTLCVGIGPSQTGMPEGAGDLRRAARCWERLGLQQILVGESELPDHPTRLCRAEVGTTATDEPRLADLLAWAARWARHDWLLLVRSDALLSQALVENLGQLCRGGAPRRLVCGRGWALDRSLLMDVDASDDPEQVLRTAIDREGILEGQDRPAWVLLPKGVLLSAPDSLGCNPAEALPWLASSAHWLGWPVLEASPAAPLAVPAASSSHGRQELESPRGVVLPHAPGAPLLSLLLAAPESQLERLGQRLQPVPGLPWEVVARPADPAEDPVAVTAAWRSALAAARGELAWPVVDPLPPLALIPVVLRSCEQPGADLLLLSWMLRGRPMPAALSWHQEPGCLVAQTSWLRRVGAFDDPLPAGVALLQIRERAERRGASRRTLPISAHPPAGAA